jgi:BCD family chlorophyll transporter-like MFS transporter
MAFTMEDVLLEPYGGEILKLSVSSTTFLTATLAMGGLIGFGLASRVLSRGADPFRMASMGALLGLPAFVAVILAAPLASASLFSFGVFLIGFGGGLFGHGTLTATMNLAPPEQRGLALGAWGAVQATGAGIAMALGGVIRDVVNYFAMNGYLGGSLVDPSTGYIVVYAIEIVLLVATMVAMAPFIKQRASPQPLQTSSGGISRSS